ncbi:MAG: glutamate racemase [Tepidimonas ignava]|uniref:glutamate racemase n=1 Tax=Tepidimonas ignava TaxID=114249 RepID=UPI002FDB1218
MAHATIDADAPIGVFDSGVGGLSVLRALHALLPAERLLYVADSGHAPYGDKPVAYVQARAEHCLDTLRRAGCKAAVVACNTVTGLSIGALRARHPDWPIVAIEPAVKPAVAATRSGTVAVLATRNTVRSAGLARLIEQHGGGVRVLAQACPGWVERVEQGRLDGPETERMVAEVVGPLVQAGADVLALGCTHFPFLRPVIERVAGPGVQVLDPAPAVARELQRRLQAAGALRRADGRTATLPLLTSGDPATVATVAQRLLGDSLTVHAAPLP